jgi:hypothetical protein
VIAGLIGRIEIPRLGLSSIVIEGASTKTLRMAGVCLFARRSSGILAVEIRRVLLLDTKEWAVSGYCSFRK